MNNEFREFPLLVDSAIGKQIEKKMNSSVDSTVISGHDKIQFILRSVHCPLSSFHVVELRLISRDYFASTHMLRELKILSSVHFWIGISSIRILQKFNFNFLFPLHEYSSLNHGPHRSSTYFENVKCRGIKSKTIETVH